MIAAVTNLPYISAFREQLTILVSTGKGKEAIDVQLAHDQVQDLGAKHAEKHYESYEIYVGVKTTETLIESFQSLVTKALGMMVTINSADALRNDLKTDDIIRKETSKLAGWLALRCGWLRAVDNAMLLQKHIDFSAAFFEAAERQDEQSSETTE